MRLNMGVHGALLHPKTNAVLMVLKHLSKEDMRIHGHPQHHGWGCLVFQQRLHANTTLALTLFLFLLTWITCSDCTIRAGVAMPFLSHCKAPVELAWRRKLCMLACALRSLPYSHRQLHWHSAKSHEAQLSLCGA